jgi:hypothetical protein
MSNYAKATDFASKDSLATGNPLKVIKGTEINDEFEAIETAFPTKADAANAALTGTPTAPTASAGTNTTQIATTAFVTGAGFAPLASPTFTGTPEAPTASAGTDTTQIATTAFTTDAVTTHAALRSSSSVFGHAKIYASGGDLYIETV